MFAILCPGQGSQRPGLLEPWLEVPGIEARLRAWSDLLDCDLVRLGTEADAEELRQTRNAQRLIFASSVVVGSWLLGEVAAVPQLVAGHSIGEWSAAVLADVLAPEDAARLVGIRADAMQAACADGSTGMVALIGGDLETAEAAAAQHELHVANVNAPNQSVLGGPLAALDSLIASPPAGVRTRRLEVAGAFHTPRMRPAVDVLAAAAATARPAPAAVPVLSNADGKPVRDGGDLLSRLVGQVAAPVRWDLVTAALNRFAVDVVVEVEPAGVLAGLVRRALPDVTVIGLKDPAQLAEVREAVEKSSSTSPLNEGVTA